MYTPGKLIYFNPFYFKNGDPERRKYFLVLKLIDSKVVIASLPSSKIYLPSTVPFNHGCLEMPDSGINCYLFEANKVITKNGWSFDLNTILYGTHLDDYEISTLTQTYVIEGVDYEIVGELTDAELKKIIDCFTNSSLVKRKYRKLLSGK